VIRVWIDQDECSGVGVCVDACPQVFTLGDDGLAYLRSADGLRGSHQPVDVDDALAESVLDAADDCPQDCIHVDSGPAGA
jgi:ferredoxin